MRRGSGLAAKGPGICWKGRTAVHKPLQVSFEPRGPDACSCTQATGVSTCRPGRRPGTAPAGAAARQPPGSAAAQAGCSARRSPPPPRRPRAAADAPSPAGPAACPGRRCASGLRARAGMHAESSLTVCILQRPAAADRDGTEAASACLVETTDDESQLVMKRQNRLAASKARKRTSRIVNVLHDLCQVLQQLQLGVHLHGTGAC